MTLMVPCLRSTAFHGRATKLAWSHAGMDGSGDQGAPAVPGRPLFLIKHDSSARISRLRDCDRLLVPLAILAHDDLERIAVVVGLRENGLQGLDYLAAMPRDSFRNSRSRNRSRSPW